MKYLLLFFLLVFGGILNLQSQDLVTIAVAPTHSDWNYHVGENVRFNISVYKFKALLGNVEITYRIGKEKMPARTIKTETLTNGTSTIDAGTLEEPGFLTCEVSLKYQGSEYRDWSSAAFDPEKIKPTTTLPADFVQFWDSTKATVAKIPMETRMVLATDLSTDKVTVYRVNFRNLKGRIYGYACVPSKPGKYPALLYVPWAGVYAVDPEVEAASREVITFSFNIHGIPNNLEKRTYIDLQDGALQNYAFLNLDNRNDYYMRNAYMAGLRSIDFLTALPEYDGTNLGVIGLSQGGGLSIITASLDSRVKYLSCTYPALCDFTGYLSQRAGGWPHLFASDKTITGNRVETSKYFDAVNFARFLKVPGIYSWGYNDNVCPPTSMFSAYNVVTAPKELRIFPDRKHESYSVQREMSLNWIIEKLKGQN